MLVEGKLMLALAALIIPTSGFSSFGQVDGFVP